MSLAKLTSLSTQTLSLLLERERLPAAPTLHLAQVTQNMRALRTGIGALAEGTGPPHPDVEQLRVQYERMRGMLGEETAAAAGIESLSFDPPPRSPSPPPLPTIDHDRKPSPEPVYEPYTDDPDAEPGILLQTQQQMMDAQDTRLDHLSHSISRQHHISLQINDELDVHTGLLEELDTDLDRTGARMSGARRRLERVARGVKGNGSTVTIASLILVLLILIVVFKT
ncbi:hypothetical protein BV22DRAFT_1032747 [Leucogyrophana mollusca]|uniref:Uncharacterized protein n=1 Tax=Leucogyrophana mollusca TaxID=85980 RepID=A0ACB8BMR9_9AGAM|nr:hypothetical protein BV22DRAFT_1032747 [Leucogyrophana mollusca]